MVKLPFFTAAAAALGAAITANVGQGLYGLHRFPDGPPALPFTLDDATPADLHGLPRHQLVALWHHLDAAETPPPGRYDGTILPAGPLTPFSLFISHTLWNDAPRGFDRWAGKVFEEVPAAPGASRAGMNRFSRKQKRDEEALSRRFVMDPRESSIDGRRSLTLDYSAENGLFWGTMRDELREVRPGLLLGLGSIGALGGALNSAVFCLEAAPVGVARTSTGG